MAKSAAVRMKEMRKRKKFYADLVGRLPRMSWQMFR